MTNMRRLQHKASAWLSVSPSKQNETINHDVRNEHDPLHGAHKQSRSHALALDTNLRCQCEVASEDAQEILLLVEAQAYFPERAVNQLRQKSNAIDVVFILDCFGKLDSSDTALQGVQATTMAMNHLRPVDSVCLLSTAAGSDDDRLIQRLSTLSGATRRKLDKRLSEVSHLLQAAQETDFFATFNQGLQILFGSSRMVGRDLCCIFEANVRVGIHYCSYLWKIVLDA